MANTFKNFSATGVTTETTVYTGPASTQTTIIGLSIANTFTSPANVDVKLNDVFIVKGAPIPVGSSLVPIGGDQKIVVTETDTIKVTSDVTVDIVGSVLEIT